MKWEVAHLHFKTHIMVTGKRAGMHSCAHSTILTTGLRLAWHLGCMQTCFCWDASMLCGCLGPRVRCPKRHQSSAFLFVFFLGGRRDYKMSTPSTAHLRVSSMLQDFHPDRISRDSHTDRPRTSPCRLVTAWGLQGVRLPLLRWAVWAAWYHRTAQWPQ